MDFKPGSTRTKIDYFINGKLIQIFKSYEHAAQFFKIELNDSKIKESNIRSIINFISENKISIPLFFRRIKVEKKNENTLIFKTNLEFKSHFKISSTADTSRIINGSLKSIKTNGYIISVFHNIPDIRPHKEITDKHTIFQICVFCKKNKPFTDTNFPYRSEGILQKKCKSCVYERIGDTPTQNFLNDLTEDWKHHKIHNFLYFEKETNRIFNTNTGNYLDNDSVKINEKCFSTKDLKWETFYGEIKQNYIVKFKDDTKNIYLNNLNCVLVYCKNCNNLIENPTSILNTFCSNNCSELNRRKNDLEEKRINLKVYLTTKIESHNRRNKKNYNNLVIDYDTDYLFNLGINCFYCNIECKFGHLINNEQNHPDILSFDKKNPDIGYCKENVVQCCWFCNRMKNQTTFEDWLELIEFLKNPLINELDLSNKTFTSKNEYTSKAKNGNCNLWTTLKNESPKYYTKRNSSYETFKEIVIKQNKKDPIFNFFPIVFLNQNCLFNYSIDAIDTKLPNEEKHRPNNLQIVPKFLNFAKNDISSNELFLIEWNKRNFKNDFSNCSIKLPEKYIETSYLEERLKIGINKKIGKGKKGIVNSREAIERAKQTKINNGTLLKGEKHPCAKRIIRVDLKTKEEKEYAYITLAANELADTGKYKSKIPGMIGKIQNVAEGKVEKGGYCRKKAYGYSWKFPEN